MSMDQMNHYQRKLAYEMDSADLYVALGENEPIVIVDGRSAEAYAEEHIPGAINLPHKAICFNSVESLDSSKVYVCYCDGIGCNASTKTALKLLTLGYQVRELRSAVSTGGSAMAMPQKATERARAPRLVADAKSVRD